MLNRCCRHAAQSQVRVREGTSAEEVKEEPDDLIPTQAELPLVERMRAHGCRADDAVQSLRKNGHDINASLQHAFDITYSRQNSRMEDMARLESEKEKQRVADAQRHEDMTLTVLGDIEPRFREVRWGDGADRMRDSLFRQFVWCCWRVRSDTRLGMLTVTAFFLWACPRALVVSPAVFSIFHGRYSRIGISSWDEF